MRLCNHRKSALLLKYIISFPYTDLTDNASFDKVKFWVDQLKAAEPVSCLKSSLGVAQIKHAVTHH